MRRRARRRAAGAGAGFTLIELLMVIAIIGIIMAFVLVAAYDGVRAAELRGTQALITKLETALNDRLEGLLTTQVDVNAAHQYLASVPTANGTLLPGNQRSMVIARFDYIKAEFPDVFLVQNDPNYPINFAGLPYPGIPLPQPNNPPLVPPPQYAPFILPLGNTMQNAAQSGGSSFGAGNLAVPTGSGIFGASYAAASGIYSQLDYLPQGYDGLDNNTNGLVDELLEGVNASNQAQVQQNLLNLSSFHKHKTARAEMLYAILVSGRSPLGSSPFRPEDFRPGVEVKDTDGDGLLEFVDAWGEPLQFYRWPIHYHSDIQKGWLPYQFSGSTSQGGAGATIGSSFEARQQNPLDTGQQLVAPAWFSDWMNGANGGLPSQNALLFMNFFTGLVEPNWTPNGTPYLYWDRGGFYSRRAFFSRFLIVSAGPDQQLGLARLGALNSPNFEPEDYDGDGQPDIPLLNPPVLSLTLIENEATDYPIRQPTAQVGFQLLSPNGLLSHETLLEQGQDDISNQSVKGPGALR